jgi:hypothetical protein
VARRQAFPKTHDLAALSDLCSQANILILVDQDWLQRLAAYAVLVRYPGEDPTLTTNESVAPACGNKLPSVQVTTSPACVPPPT